MWVNKVSDDSNPSLQATPVDTNWRRDVLYFTESCSNYRGLEGGNGNSGDWKKVINLFVLPLLIYKHLLVSKATPCWRGGTNLCFKRCNLCDKILVNDPFFMQLSHMLIPSDNLNLRFYLQGDTINDWPLYYLTWSPYTNRLLLYYNI